MPSDQGRLGLECQHERSRFFKKVESMGLMMLRLRGGAEVGKGDPRWIVKELEDGKNVGAWHWEERDMLPFARLHNSYFQNRTIFVTNFFSSTESNYRELLQ